MLSLRVNPKSEKWRDLSPEIPRINTETPKPLCHIELRQDVLYDLQWTWWYDRNASAKDIYLGKFIIFHQPEFRLFGDDSPY